MRYSWFKRINSKNIGENNGNTMLIDPERSKKR